MTSKALIDAMMTKLTTISSWRGKLLCFSLTLVLVFAVYNMYRNGNYTSESITLKHMTMFENFKLNHERIVKNVTQHSKICYVGRIGKEHFKKKIYTKFNQSIILFINFFKFIQKGVGYGNKM
jgi:hypothetical protein